MLSYMEAINQHAADQFVVICASKIGSMAWRGHAVSNGDKWATTEPFDFGQAEMGDMPEWMLGARPFADRQYTYLLIVNTLVNDQPSATMERELKRVAALHDQTFHVEPYTEIVALLETIDEDTATFLMEIDFDASRPWRMVELRRVAHLDLYVQPDKFSSSLRIAGWQQTMPPVHQTGKKYNVLIERGTDGSIFKINSRTDVQDHRLRNQGFAAHFITQLGAK